VDAPKVADLLGVGRVWVKDESWRLGLPAFKIMGASWAVYRALEKRFGNLEGWEDLDELKERLAPLLPLTLAAATDGNHGRAVARMGKLLGFGARGTPHPPRDALHIDTGWFEKEPVCDLEFSEGRFPDPAGMVKRLRGQGFRVSLWQWPNMVLESKIVGEGREGGFLAKRANG